MRLTEKRCQCGDGGQNGGCGEHFASVSADGGQNGGCGVHSERIALVSLFALWRLVRPNMNELRDHDQPEPQGGPSRDAWIASGLPYDAWVAETSDGRQWARQQAAARIIRSMKPGPFARKWRACP